MWGRYSIWFAEYYIIWKRQISVKMQFSSTIRVLSSWTPSPLVPASLLTELIAYTLHLYKTLWNSIAFGLLHGFWLIWMLITVDAYDMLKSHYSQRDTAMTMLLHDNRHLLWTRPENRKKCLSTVIVGTMMCMYQRCCCVAYCIIAPSFDYNGAFGFSHLGFKACHFDSSAILHALLLFTCNSMMLMYCNRIHHWVIIPSSKCLIYCQMKSDDVQIVVE